MKYIYNLDRTLERAEAVGAGEQLNSVGGSLMSLIRLNSGIVSQCINYIVLYPYLVYYLYFFLENH